MVVIFDIVVTVLFIVVILGETVVVCESFIEDMLVDGTLLVVLFNNCTTVDCSVLSVILLLPVDVETVVVELSAVDMFTTLVTVEIVDVTLSWEGWVIFDAAVVELISKELETFGVFVVSPVSWPVVKVVAVDSSLDVALLKLSVVVWELLVEFLSVSAVVE